MSSSYPRKIDATIEQVRSIYSQLLEAIEAKVSREPTANEEAVINNASSSGEGEGEGEGERTVSTNSMERVIQTVLQEYINEVVEMASNSLNVVNAATGTDGPLAANSNGNVGILRQLLQQTQGEYVEPFDLELNERVRQKYQEWEELTVKVVQLRKNGPQEVNKQYSLRQREFFDALDKQLERLAVEEAGLEAIAADSGDTADDQGNGEDTGNGTTEVDVRSYVDSLRDLYEAKEGIASVRQSTDKLRGLFAALETD